MNLMIRVIYSGTEFTILKNIKIGQYLCNQSIDNYSYDDRQKTSDFICTTPQSNYLSISNFNVQTDYGFSSQLNILQKYPLTEMSSDSSKSFPYYFKIFPKIISISSSSGSVLGGQTLTITGKGFNEKNYIYFGSSSYSGNNTCKIIAINQETIACTTRKLDSNIPSERLETSQGPRKRISNDYTDNFIKDTTILEIGSIYSKNSAPGFDFIEGKFCPKFTGYYRFYSTSLSQSLKFSLKSPTENSEFEIVIQRGIGYTDVFKSSII